jgi:hypothetical protein
MKKLFENWNKFLNESDAWRSSLFSHMQSEKQDSDNMVNDLIDKSQLLKNVIDRYPEYEDRLKAKAQEEIFNANVGNDPKTTEIIIRAFSEVLKDIDLGYSKFLSQQYSNEAPTIR